MVRSLLRSMSAFRARPAFTIVVVLSLALGIAATTMTYHFVDRFLLNPLDVEKAERLVEMELTWQGDDETQHVSYPSFRDYRRDSEAFTDMAVYAQTEVLLGTGESRELLVGQLVSPNYFSLLGVSPVVGRVPSAEEAGRQVLVLGHELWRQRFGASPEVLGRDVTLNEAVYEVIGVAPDGFSGLQLSAPADFWIPIETFPRVATGFMAMIEPLGDRGIGWLRAVGRLSPDFDLETATTDMTMLARSTEVSAKRDLSDLSVRLTPIHVSALGRERRAKLMSFMSMLVILVSLELAITCVNLSGMFIARGLQQRHEVAVRYSLGMPRWDLLREFILEGVGVTAMAATLGVLGAQALIAYLQKVQLPGLPDLVRPADAFGPAYLLVVGGLALLLVWGLSLPVAWRLGRLSPAHQLQGASARTVNHGARLRTALIVGQVAVAVVLVLGTGLFVRSLMNVWQVDPGFDAERVVDVRLNLGPYGYSEPRARQFYQEVAEQVRASPGVVDAAWAGLRPLGGGRIEMGVRVDGQSRNREPVTLAANVVAPGYLPTLGIRLLEGRELSPRDREGSPMVGMLNAAGARRLFPDGRALGSYLVLPGDEPRRLEIVGVVDDVKVESLDEDPTPYLYLPLDQHFGLVGLRAMHLLVRSGGSSETAVSAVRSVVHRVDPEVTLLSAEVMERTIQKRFAAQQVGTVVLGVLSAFALVLVTSGIYGLLTSFVAERTREIGLRLALGARSSDVARMVLSKSLLPVVAGLVVGVAAAALLLDLVASLLFGVSPLDPATLVTSLGLLLLVALVASSLPAMRAARVDPMAALRQE